MTKSAKRPFGWSLGNAGVPDAGSGIVAWVSPRLWIGVCAVTLLTAGCQGAGPHDAQPTPTGPCNHWSTNGDPGLGAGFGYDESAHHPFDTPVPATMCGLSSEH